VRVNVQFTEIAMHRIYQLLLISTPMITLAINPWSNFDPISLPKMLILTSVGASLCFLLTSRNKDFRVRLPRHHWLVFTIFLTWLVTVILFSGASLTQQLWGSFGRNTGFVTYFSLLMVLIAAAILQNRSYYAGFARALVGTAVPMTAYCLVQMYGRDPIGWSEFAAFGTLGNVNFLSAFLGMTSIACISLTLDSKAKLTSRIFLAGLAVLDIFIAYSTGSIQGVVIFTAGIFALLYVQIHYIKSSWKRVYSSLYLVTLFASTFAGIAGLINKGPLAKFLFQQSVIFRADYMHAGWEMTVTKPLFGVGLDSYGEWYRETRGEISTLRTGDAGVNRVSNSAHNIFLDISSNGGLVLGVSFVAIMVLAGISAIKFLRSRDEFDPYFAAIVSVWFAYQVQALVSINQIGVGIWGWLLSGVLIGYGRLSKTDSVPQESGNSKNKNRRSFRGVPLSARDSIAAILGFIVGTFVAVPPLTADIAYRSASLTGDIAQITQAVNKIGSTQFHKELALDFALRNNKVPETSDLAKQLVIEFPRNFFAWRVLSVLTDSTPYDREKALIRVRSLDPFNPEGR